MALGEDGALSIRSGGVQQGFVRSFSVGEFHGKLSATLVNARIGSIQ